MTQAAYRFDIWEKEKLHAVHKNIAVWFTDTRKYTQRIMMTDCSMLLLKLSLSFCYRDA